MAMKESDLDVKATQPSLGGGGMVGGVALDLVERMDILYMKVVRGKELPINSESYVQLKLGRFKSATGHLGVTSNPEWNEVFLISKDVVGTTLEISVREKSRCELIGMVVFDPKHVPQRMPPDIPLAPEWYRLHNRRGESVLGELMLCVWMGTQADEAFAEARPLDVSGVDRDGLNNIRSKVYLTPHLCYLRVNVIEAKRLQIGEREHANIIVVARHRDTRLRTKFCELKNGNHLWNEDLMFTVAQPSEDQLVFYVVWQTGDRGQELGRCVIPLHGVKEHSCDKPPESKWYRLERHTVATNGQKFVYRLESKLHLKICLDGGYHVIDELPDYTSDFRAADSKASKKIGQLELGILNAQNLDRVTNAYCVAKYGGRWIRTRTALKNSNPKWNEQCSWEVFDPCTVVTVGVFDNKHVRGADGNTKDLRIGKVRIRLSNLENGRVYTHLYPLIGLSTSGFRKMGEIHLAVKLSWDASRYHLLLLYTRPLFPTLHYTKPMSKSRIENLRMQAISIISDRFSRSEPPLRQEVVRYMLDFEVSTWSSRRTKANWFRIHDIVSENWERFDRVCRWDSYYTSFRVAGVYFGLVWYTFWMWILITVWFMMTGVWTYIRRPRQPHRLDLKLTHTGADLEEELEEESPSDVASLQLRCHRLRLMGREFQDFLGNTATEMERISSLFSWRDPRATCLVYASCLFVLFLLCVLPPRHMLTLLGLYVMCPPRYRWLNSDSYAINIFRRFAGRSDDLL